MPKKSDRKEHESAMSSLLPEVSLDESPDADASDDDSSTELQNSSTSEEENYTSETAPEESRERVRSSLSILPGERPELQQKLGPYVSADVDNALEEVYLLLRRRLGGHVSKSLIVEAALRLVLSDYLQRERDSEVAKWMEKILKDD